MGQIPERGISRLSLSLIMLLSVQEWNSFGFAPQGCEFANYSSMAICYFQQWIPPLRDEDFGPNPFYILRIYDINGTIPAGTFGGLNGPPTNNSTHIYLHCNNCKTILSRDIFTENLHWLMNLHISNCYLENGLPARLLENLKGLESLTILGGEIDGLVAEDALTGLTDLFQITISATVKHGNLPSGFFDGLTNLTFIYLSSAELDFIPPNWFNGLISLELIILSGNNLQTLPSGLFDELRSLAYVTLNDNPWNCSCDLMWLRDWSNTIDGVLCQAPAIVENVKLEDASGLLDCLSSSNSPIPSTPVPYATEATDFPTTSTAIFSECSSVGNNKGKKNDGIVKGIRYIVLSTFGTFIVSLVVAAILYRGVWRKKYNGSVNPVNNCEEDRYGSNPQNIDTQ